MTARNLGRLFDAVPGEREAVVDLRAAKPRVLTYAALRGEVAAVACGLRRLGVVPGDRIVVASGNRAEYLALLFGTVALGAVPAPLNVKLPAATLRAVAASAGARFAFVEAGHRAAVPAGVHAIDLDDAYPAFLDHGQFDPVPVTDRTVSMQPYTSGSTGLPKGVLLTHAGQWWAAETLVRHRRLGPDDRVLVAAPLYHKNAIVAAKTALLPGACLVLMPRFEAAAYLRAMVEQRATMITGVPTMMRLLLDEPGFAELAPSARLRAISMGSSPASDRLLADLGRAFPDAEIHLNYGVTEGGPIMFGWYHPEGRPRPPHSIGWPIPGCDWRLEGGSGPDEGELSVRNPGVALGYHDRPEASAARFEGGWFRTGDVLRRDAGGWFYFVGRVDDMFVSGGENVFPQEVEALLGRHPAVQQAAVVPVPHEVKGMVPVAFVVTEGGRRVDEAELRRFALRHGPAYAHPRRVLVVDRLPLTGTNKIDKPALRAMLQEAPEEARA